jgi:hypothetical protein
MRADNHRQIQTVSELVPDRFRVDAGKLYHFMEQHCIYTLSRHRSERTIGETHQLAGVAAWFFYGQGIILRPVIKHLPVIAAGKSLDWFVLPYETVDRESRLSASLSGAGRIRGSLGNARIKTHLFDIFFSKDYNVIEERIREIVSEKGYQG